MKLIFLSSIFAAILAVHSSAQIKTITNPDPIFPAEAANVIYGDVAQVAVDVNKEGRVTRTVPIGPLTPCKNRGDKAVAAIQKAAVEAAKAVVFEPIVEDGKPRSVSLLLTYPLRPASKAGEADLVKIGDINKKAKDLPKPEFTAQAKANRISGAVVLNVLVDETGNVISFAVASGHPQLAIGTFDAACRAIFEPLTSNGKPKKSLGTITYRFVI
jgi:TonB family protein